MQGVRNSERMSWTLLSIPIKIHTASNNIIIVLNEETVMDTEKESFCLVVIRLHSCSIWKQRKSPLNIILVF